MIIQKVIKGIPRISEAQVNQILRTGIVCNWWRKVGTLPANEIPLRLTPRNLEWHQNHYTAPDPLEGGELFGRHTPFISTTAGTVERDTFAKTNIMHPAWEVALPFATESLSTDGYLFYCYLFIIGRPAVPLEAFAEEVRELNVYTAFSPFQPEGEITAKIIIPPAQIEYAEFWRVEDIRDALDQGSLPMPANTLPNNLFVSPNLYNNVRDVLR